MTSDSDVVGIENVACVPIDLGSAVLLKQVADSVGADLHIDSYTPTQIVGQIASTLATCFNLANRNHIPAGQRLSAPSIVISYLSSSHNSDIHFDRSGRIQINATPKEGVSLQACYNLMITEGRYR